MRDGRTRRVPNGAQDGDNGGAAGFLARHRASLTVLEGPAAGSEYELAASRTVVGRSPAAGIRVDDASVSSEHAAIELGAQGFSVRDLASTNGVRVNGAPVEAADLKHGDRIEVGACTLQYVVEKRTTAKAWTIDA